MEHVEAQNNPAVQHEESDVNIRAVLGFGVALVVVAVVIHFAVWLLFLFFANREAVRVAPMYPMAIGEENRLPPQPRLQTNPREDLRELRVGEDAVLGTYGWVDKANGVVRIPIEQAMKLTVQRGLPARPQSAAGAGTAASAGTDSSSAGQTRGAAASGGGAPRH